MDILSLILTCTPLVLPSIMGGIVAVASHGEPWAIYRHDTKESLHPKSEAAAIDTARRLLAQHVEISAGLTQLASPQWGRLNLTVDNVFSPCANLAAGEELLIRAYLQDAGDLDAALSRFRTGDGAAGIANGYVREVKQAAARVPGGMANGSDDPKLTAPGRRDSERGDSFKGVPDGFAEGR